MYRYRCTQCRTTSPTAHTRHEVEAERDRHRDRAHAGHIPDGEEIQTHTPPPRPGQPTRPLHYLAYAALAAVLALTLWARLTV
ncbi:MULTISPECIES: hypothetical protein [Streptomyces]|uniref:Uncharacterized protein n=1 Tax=Streptomyces fradiae ATCC 10745 = DSM 40063 TaxID=1319510 RepID=A0A1Y2NY14_STRFR|nr:MULTISPECIES: hypothetical protein [Streptomyces]KAF0649192.1 hypothetical protein K701_13870 [Streptomyces fradiae ATCC 10745 = DSM 40063]OSY51818.1 hypothetical protein BG846_02492 [Streptomyces fradiae ATCC 10745 = DSM 40063]QEV12032.1 hypothetical protein CP974_08380 [Streptomyces fradiae ATCC 10745 = DSM 40063]